MMQPFIKCASCGQIYPERGTPYRCQICGGCFVFSNPPPLDTSRVDRSLPGIWRYHHTFGLPPDGLPTSLGEGNTPLVWARAFGRDLAFKCEFQNPSGSFKDRGSTVITSWLRAQGVDEAIEDSSGNAGASFAAYAARAGIHARVFIPASASGPKCRQILAYGAELVPNGGSREELARMVQELAERGAVYASHAYLPFNIPGYATAAYEVYEQLGDSMPGTVVVPVGQGGFLLGLAHGFTQLRIANHLKNTPMLIGIQASACTPLLQMLRSGNMDPGDKPGPWTVAEGINVQNPVRAMEVMAAIRSSRGEIHAVEEDAILDGRDHLAHLGLYVEPTSAVVWPALERKLGEWPDPVVVMLTGSGCKYG